MIRGPTGGMGNDTFEAEVSGVKGVSYQFSCGGMFFIFCLLFIIFTFRCRRIWRGEVRRSLLPGASMKWTTLIA